MGLSESQTCNVFAIFNPKVLFMCNRLCMEIYLCKYSEFRHQTIIYYYYNNKTKN